MEPMQASEVVKRNRQYLDNMLTVFQSEHGDFKPVEGMMTVAQVIRHIATTTDWFHEGAFGAGFNMDFENMEQELMREVTLEAALKGLNASTQRLLDRLSAATAEDLEAPMADNPIFGPLPRYVVLFADGDHMAHHRGALSVYARLLGICPPMIYG